ncbi:uncharacterized protein At5g08430 isoform X2 [Rhodamnia argentea]|uniref:Uncharacterized protein At5g08430 isoform X2 n=1 Tax=Rhodamnia argentea TaxID=178133 RepID=A0ABM3HEK5_9MYRT|nr:uncharacterized protein At5g08430 isoform X2 [Rhodamnia argentea]
MDSKVETEPFTWLEECDGPINAPLPQKRKYQHRKKEFVGWGSRQLIEFLKSIGKDISQQIPQHDVASVITSYINENKLLHPQKKKRVVCDERLRSLFGRKTISRLKISDLLEAHYAENLEQSDEDFIWSSGDEDLTAKPLLPQRKTPKKRKVVETSESCFAALVPDNIKLIYLKRSLIQLLCKDSASFEGKVVGSFVRVKSDPNDYLQKNPYQLLQVTGVKGAMGSADTSTQVLLQVAGLFKDIPISMLSDENFTEEECEDLRQRVKDGLLKRPTVWLPKELALLQSRIERANEKGLRKELSEYLERRKLLQTPEEQSRLLREIPKVIADGVEIDSTDIPDDLEEITASPRSLHRESSQEAKCATTGNIVPVTKIPWRTNLEEHQNGHVSEYNEQVVANQRNGGGPGKMEKKGFQGTEDEGIHSTQKIEEWVQQPITDISKEERRGVVENGDLHGTKGKSVQSPKVVIDLTSDDEDEDLSSCQSQNHDYNLESLIWHYVDPQGEVRGPFSLASLKHWSPEYFPPDFKIWKVGESQSKAVLLSDILRRVCSK